MSCLAKHTRICLYIYTITICSSAVASSDTGNFSDFANGIEALTPPTQLHFDFNIQRHIAPVEISDKALEKRVRDAELRAEARTSNSNLRPDEAKAIIEQEKAREYARVEALRQGYSYIVQGDASTYDNMRNISMTRIDNDQHSQFVYDGEKSAEMFPGTAFISDESYPYLEDHENPLSWLDRRLTAIKYVREMLDNSKTDIHVSKDAKGNLSLFVHDRLDMTITFGTNGRIGKIEIYSGNGKLARRVILEDYKEITKDYAFPQNITREVFGFSENLITTEVMANMNIRIDPAVKSTGFSIRLKPGTFVTDMTHKGKKRNYKSCPVPDISAILGETKQESIKKITASDTDPDEIHSKTETVKAYFIVASLLVLVLVVSSVVYARKRKHSSV